MLYALIFTLLGIGHDLVLADLNRRHGWREDSFFLCYLLSSKSESVLLLFEQLLNYIFVVHSEVLENLRKLIGEFLPLFLFSWVYIQFDI